MLMRSSEREGRAADSRYNAAPQIQLSIVLRRPSTRSQISAFRDDTDRRLSQRLGRTQGASHLPAETQEEEKQDEAALRKGTVPCGSTESGPGMAPACAVCIQEASPEEVACKAGLPKSSLLLLEPEAFVFNKPPGQC